MGAEEDREDALKAESSQALPLHTGVTACRAGLYCCKNEESYSGLESGAILGQKSCLVAFPILVQSINFY